MPTWTEATLLLWSPYFYLSIYMKEMGRTRLCIPCTTTFIPGEERRKDAAYAWNEEQRKDWWKIRCKVKEQCECTTIQGLGEMRYQTSYGTLPWTPTHVHWTSNCESAAEIVYSACWWVMKVAPRREFVKATPNCRSWMCRSVFLNII